MTNSNCSMMWFDFGKYSSRYSSKSFIGLVFLLSMGFVSGAFAEDWGPMLLPSYPGEDGFSVETIEDRTQWQATEDGFVPEALAPADSPAPRRLPRTNKNSGVKNIYRGSGRQVVYNEMPQPNSDVIPPGFLDSDEPTAPRLQKKTKKAQTVVPKMDLESGSYDEEEYIVGEYPMDEPWTGSVSGDFRSFPLLASTDGAVGETTEVYDGMYSSTDIDSCYPAPLMLRSFGTGIMDNLRFFGTATAFRGELDGGGSGSFGFSEGLCWAGPATPQGTLAAQVGFRAVQSNIHGNGLIQKDSRNQYFLSAGLFKRDLCYPIQGGAIFDWVHDDYYDKIRVSQVRVELSVRTMAHCEYGFLGTYGVSDDENDFLDRRLGDGTVRLKVKPQNNYQIFFRKHFCDGGLAEVRLGATDRGDAILTGLGEFPLSDRLTLNGGFTAMIPSEGHGMGGWKRETWELSVGMVFYFRGGATTKPYNTCRPMFETAGNGTFFNRISRK